MFDDRRDRDGLAQPTEERLSAGRKDDFGIFWIRSIEDDGVTDDSADDSARSFRQCSRDRLFVRRLPQAHLDELMAGQCLVERTNKRIAQAAFSYEDDRFQRMSQSAQVAALGSVEDGRGGN